MIAASLYPAPIETVLLEWFSARQRPLPWRATRDPYAILVSEVMSQQYRVENVEFPAVHVFLA